MAIIYCTATSLDGFLTDETESLSWLFATPDHSRDPGGRYGDDDTLGFDGFLSDVGAIVLGANSLQWIAHELGRGDASFEWPYSQPTWVLTHRDVPLPAGLHRFAGDVAELLPDLERAAGDRHIWVLGGGDLAGQFADIGRLDKVWVHLCPVTLGSGKPLLPRRLRLRREKLERDGQFTAILFEVVGPEPRPEPGALDGMAQAMAGGAENDPAAEGAGGTTSG